MLLHATVRYGARRRPCSDSSLNNEWSARYFGERKGPCPEDFIPPKGYAQLTRFLPKEIQRHFDCRVAAAVEAEAVDGGSSSAAVRQSIRQEVRALWG